MKRHIIVIYAHFMLINLNFEIIELDRVTQPDWLSVLQELVGSMVAEPDLVPSPIENSSTGTDWH